MDKRFNIYVPLDLREPMAALGRAVNWSAICQVAIRREINRRSAKKRKRNAA